MFVGCVGSFRRIGGIGMSKERLEEIKQYLIHFYNAVDVEEDIKVYIFNTLKIEWLIEQAERVQELEETVEDYKTVNKELHQRGRKIRKQNKRLREALEEIARGRFPGASYKARKALGGEG